MPSDFQTMCASARATIPVPEFPVGAIRDAAKVNPIPAKPRKRIVAIALSGLLLVGAVATAADLWQKAHVSFGPSGSVRMSTDEFHTMTNPAAHDLRTIAEHATFPVQYPSGLPAGTTIAQVGYGTSAILLIYNLPGASRRSNHLLPIWLVDPRALTSPDSPYLFKLSQGGWAARGSVAWPIGKEVVIVMRSSATQAELENVKRSMTAATQK